MSPQGEGGCSRVECIGVKCIENGFDFVDSSKASLRGKWKARYAHALFIIPLWSTGLNRSDGTSVWEEWCKPSSVETVILTVTRYTLFRSCFKWSRRSNCSRLWRISIEKSMINLNTFNSIHPTPIHSTFPDPERGGSMLCGTQAKLHVPLSSDSY